MRRPSPWLVEALALVFAVFLSALLGATLARIDRRERMESARLSIAVPDPVPLPARTCLRVRAAPDGSPFYIPTDC